MGVWIRLHTLPSRVDPQLWARTFDEAVQLAASCPMPLVSYRVREVRGFRRYELTREIVSPEGDELIICGDAETRERAETFVFKRNYQAAPSAQEYRDFDILSYSPDELPYELDRKTQGQRYHYAIEGLAALFESRMHGAVVVSGDISFETSTKAIRWVNKVLSEPIELPVCVDSERLVARLKGCLPPEEVMERFQDWFRGSATEEWSARCQFLADTDPSEDALAKELQRMGDGKVTLGTHVGVRGWLDATGDLETLIRAACQNPKGPRWTADEIIQILGDTWVLLSHDQTKELQRLSERDDAFGSLFGIFGGFYPELHTRNVLQGYRPGLSRAVETISSILNIPKKPVLQQGRKLVQRQLRLIRKTIEDLEADLEEQSSAPKAAALPDLSESINQQKDALRAELAKVGRDLSPDTLHTMIAAASQQAGLVLLAETWDRIDGVKDMNELSAILILATRAAQAREYTEEIEELIEGEEYRKLIV